MIGTLYAMSMFHRYAAVPESMWGHARLDLEHKHTHTHIQRARDYKSSVLLTSALGSSAVDCSPAKLNSIVISSMSIYNGSLDSTVQSNSYIQLTSYHFEYHLPLADLWSIK